MPSAGRRREGSAWAGRDKGCWLARGSKFCGAINGGWVTDVREPKFSLPSCVYPRLDKFNLIEVHFAPPRFVGFDDITDIRGFQAE